MSKKNKKHRLFIETDVLKEDELHSAQNIVSNVLDGRGADYPKEVFDETKDFAWHEADAAWEAVKRADEIYGDSALVPLLGVGSYSGAPVIMDTMMQKTIDEGIEGKSLYFLRQFKDIWWDQIEVSLMRKAFEKNKLFTLNYDEESYQPFFVAVNIDKLIEKYKDNG